MKFIQADNQAVPVEKIRRVVAIEGGGIFIAFDGDDSFKRRLSEDASLSMVDNLCRDLIPAPSGFSVVILYLEKGEKPLKQVETVLAFLVSRDPTEMVKPVTMRGVIDLWDDNHVLVDPLGVAQNQERTYDRVEDFISERIAAT